MTSDRSTECLPQHSHYHIHSQFFFLCSFRWVHTSGSFLFAFNFRDLSLKNKKRDSFVNEASSLFAFETLHSWLTPLHFYIQFICIRVKCWNRTNGKLLQYGFFVQSLFATIWTEHLSWHWRYGMCLSFSLVQCAKQQNMPQLTEPMKKLTTIAFYWYAVN